MSSRFGVDPLDRHSFMYFFMAMLVTKARSCSRASRCFVDFPSFEKLTSLQRVFVTSCLRLACRSKSAETLRQRFRRGSSSSSSSTHLAPRLTLIAFFSGVPPEVRSAACEEPRGGVAAAAVVPPGAVDDAARAVRPGLGGSQPNSSSKLLAPT